MSDVSGNERLPKPRISVQGIEAIAADHASYENAGLVECWKWSAYVTNVFTLRGAYHVKGEGNHWMTDLNRFLDDTDWYAVRILKDGDDKIVGDLYVRKSNAPVPVVDIQVGGRSA